MKKLFNYPQLAAEFLIVFVAVALAADEWRQGLQDRNLERSYLERLEVDLRSGRRRIATYHERFDSVPEASSLLIRHLESEHPLMESDQLFELAAKAAKSGFYDASGRSIGTATDYNSVTTIRHESGKYVGQANDYGHIIQVFNSEGDLNSSITTNGNSITISKPDTWSTGTRNTWNSTQNIPRLNTTPYKLEYTGTTRKRPNLLFIAVDDLRPQLGCYGESWMKTPNIDRLASKSRVFNRHYVQVPTCGASRHALLTGLRPAVAADYGNGPFKVHKEELAAQKTESFPHLFKQNGYRTVAIGKISHSNVSSLDDLPRSWSSDRLLERRWGDRHNFVNAYAQLGLPEPDPKPRNKGYPFEAAPVDDKGYPDGWIAEHAVNALRKLKDQPFFLAVGFMKPHLPFNAPQKYWDLYDPETIPDIQYPNVPDGINPGMSLHPSFELMGQYDVPDGALEDPEYIRKLRHGYCAAVSYTDAQVGKILEELDRLKLSENTIVVLWGDHGWHLGDLGTWGKHTAFEHALRSPLIVRAPGMEEPGASSDALIETVDIYPTLAELFGLIAPAGLGGDSFADVLNNADAKGPEAAFGYHRPWAYENNPHKPGPWAKTIRTDRYRFTRWTTEIGGSEVVQLELYDHKKDPQESHNIANSRPQLVRAMLSKLADEREP